MENNSTEMSHYFIEVSFDAGHHGVVGPFEALTEEEAIQKVQDELGKVVKNLVIGAVTTTPPTVYVNDEIGDEDAITDENVKVIN